MASRPPPLPGDSPNHIAIETAAHERGGRLTAVVSAIALVFSGYSLWESSLKAASITPFVSPVIQYSSPYQGNNFEMFAVPVTLLNDGGRTGTVISMQLAATNLKTNETKRFYAADFGRWTMEKTRAGAYEPFAPIALAGKSSRTETVLFYTLNPEEKPDQLVTEPGKFRFTLTLDEAKLESALDRLTSNAPPLATFEAELRYFDARAFQNGTLPLYATASPPPAKAP